MKSKKVLRYSLIIAVVAIIALLVGKKQGWFGSEYRIKVAVEEGERRDLIEIITANGKIQPETEVKLSPDVSGEIVELYIKEGDGIKKGDLLLKIKPDNYISALNRTEATLNNTKARLKQAEAQLIQARLEFERMTKLWDQKAISEADFQQAETSYQTAAAEKEAAEFSVASAEASLREAEENLRKTSIYAPMTGTISMLNVELGERVVGTELMTGTELLRIADLNRMEVEVEVNENDIVRVHQYDTALIEVDAYLGRKFKGLVTEIPVSAMTTGTTTDQVTNFNVKVLLIPDSYKDLINSNSLTPFRPGMSATADIQTSRKSNVYSIPIQAVTTRADTSLHDPGIREEENGKRNSENLEVVFVAVADSAKMIKVETGIQDDQYIEITTGLNEDDKIIVAPYSAVSRRLENNNLLEIVDRKELFQGNNNKNE